MTCPDRCLGGGANGHHPSCPSAPEPERCIDCGEFFDGDYHDCEYCTECQQAPCECAAIEDTAGVARWLIADCESLLDDWPADHPNAPAHLNALITEARAVLAWLQLPEESP